MTKLFCKPAKQGGVVRLAPGLFVWTRTKPMEHLTCWCGGWMTRMWRNGCVRYVPGSHRWGLLEKPSLAGDLNGILIFLRKNRSRNFHPVPVETKAGYGNFHHPLTLHWLGRKQK